MKETTRNQIHHRDICNLKVGNLDPREQHLHNKMKIGKDRESILIPPNDDPLVGRDHGSTFCVTVQTAAEQPGCPCWPPGSGYRQKTHCKSQRRGQQCLWRCMGAHPVWPGCSRLSKRKHIRSIVVQLNQCVFLITSELCCKSMLGTWTVCPSRLANLGDNTGLFPDCEASTEHLSPRVVLSGRVSGQSDRTQSDQIRVPERDKRG